MPVYAWDTTVFLAWLNNETDKPLADVRLVWDEVAHRKASLKISSQVIYEISAVKYTPDQIDVVKKFLRRGSVEVCDVTQQIAWKAGELRDKLMASNKAFKKADLIILATALIEGADALHTFNYDHLLRLDGDALVGGLRIIRPIPFTGRPGST